MKRPVVIVLACLALVSGCSDPTKDPLQVVQNATAATPAVAPATKTPAGQRIPVGAPIRDTTFSAKFGVLALATDSALLLSRQGQKPTRVPLPGVPGLLSVDTQGEILVPIPKKNVVLIVDPDSRKVATVQVPGQPTSAASFQGRLLVALPDKHGVATVRGDRVDHVITGSITPQQIIVSGEHAAVLDTKSTAIYDLNIDDQQAGSDGTGGSIGAGLRVGSGAARATADKYGRVLVTDARSGGLLAYSLAPLLARQFFPVSNAPYGIAYDPTRDLIWVTLTGSNELVGYAVGQGEPVLKHRFPTVAQPDSVTVDPRDGTVYVASAGKDGVAVMRP